MNQTSLILAASLSLAVVGDVLFRAPLGLNLVVWLLLLLAWSARASRISPFHSGLAVPILFFAACTAWRDSSFLAVSNTAAVLGLLTLPFTQRAGVVLRCGTITAYLQGAWKAVSSLWLNTACFLTSDVAKMVTTSRTYRLSGPVAVGMAGAVPLSTVFLILFSSADPAFARVIETVFRVNSGTVFSHVIFGGVIGLASMGYLHGIAQPAERVTTDAPSIGLHRFGIIEVAIPLGAMIVTFCAFLAFQLPYLFGGLGMVRSSPDLSFATYARSGFFELTTASALVVPVLLVGDWLLESNETTRRLFNRLAVVQIALVGVLMASSLQRMALYWQAYGLTTTRLYATAFMGWIGCVLVWFTLTVLRGRRKRFAFGSIVSGLCFLAALNFANPEGLIVRMNLARGVERFDWEYASQLSADATPSLLAGLSGVAREDRCPAAVRLTNRWTDGATDWRSWNVSRYRASQAVERVREPLLRRCGGQGAPP